jgi:hypothetical protein
MQGWFGFTGTHANVWLRFGRRMLLKALMMHPEAAVKFPDDNEIEKLKDIVKQRHPNLTNVYCTMDGVKLYFEQCKELDVQSMYYSGWQHDHFVTNLICFSACGRIICCVLNVPGSVHDSTMALWGGVYDQLESAFERHGGQCCVDSAFSSTNVPYLIKSAQDLTECNAFDRLERSQATSLRQAAEWGMGAIQSSMPRLKDRIPYEAEDIVESERSIVLRLMPLLYNFRLEFVGLNQLRNTYVPNWSVDIDYYIKY